VLAWPLSLGPVGKRTERVTKFVHDFFDGQEFGVMIQLGNLGVSDHDAEVIVEYIFDRFKRVDPIFPESPDEKYALAYAALVRDAASCAQRLFAAKWGRDVGELNDDDQPLSQKRFTDPFLIAMQQEVAELEAEAMMAESR
jgi:hypothetical protein